MISRKNRYLQHNMRKVVCRVIFAHLTALLLVGNAALSCRAAGESALTCVMEGTDENGYLGMRIDVSADPDVEAYDFDVLYDPKSVTFGSVEERCGEPRAFEYKDYDREGILRVVGLVGEVVVGEKTLLYIRWKPVTEEDVNYVPTLSVRDLADEAGEDIPCRITYEDAGGTEVVPSPGKQETVPDENGSGDGGSPSTEKTSEDNVDAGEDAAYAQESAEAPDGTSGTGQEATEESQKSGESTKSVEKKSVSGSAGTGKTNGQTAGIDVRASDGESGTETSRDTEADADRSAEESVTEEIRDDSAGTGVSKSDGRAGLRKSGNIKNSGTGDETEETEKVDAGSAANPAVIIGIAVALTAARLEYYRRKRT